MGKFEVWPFLNRLGWVPYYGEDMHLDFCYQLDFLRFLGGLSLHLNHLIP